MFCPGWLNQVNLFIQCLSIFFGQYNKICGVNHGFMYTIIVAVPTIQFHHFIITVIKIIKICSRFDCTKKCHFKSQLI